ncbi:MAG: peptide chain release factor-like protein [Elusimicrobiales bacterium]
MNFPELSDITPAKVQALRERIARLGLDLRLVDEQFTRGSGNGGQKINKTSNAVQLRYPALGLVVKCQRERKRSLNRFLALRELVDEIEVRVSPGTSERLKEIAKIRRKKARGRKRGAGPVTPADT